MADLLELIDDSLHDQFFSYFVLQLIEDTRWRQRRTEAVWLEDNSSFDTQSLYQMKIDYRFIRDVLIKIKNDPENTDNTKIQKHLDDRINDPKIFKWTKLSYSIPIVRTNRLFAAKLHDASGERLCRHNRFETSQMMTPVVTRQFLNLATNLSNEFPKKIPVPNVLKSNSITSLKPILLQSMRAMLFNDNASTAERFKKSNIFKHNSIPANHAEIKEWMASEIFHAMPLNLSFNKIKNQIDTLDDVLLGIESSLTDIFTNYSDKLHLDDSYYVANSPFLNPFLWVKAFAKMQNWIRKIETPNDYTSLIVNFILVAQKITDFNKELLSGLESIKKDSNIDFLQRQKAVNLINDFYNEIRFSVSTYVVFSPIDIVINTPFKISLSQNIPIKRDLGSRGIYRPETATLHKKIINFLFRYPRRAIRFTASILKFIAIKFKADRVIQAIFKRPLYSDLLSTGYKLSLGDTQTLHFEIKFPDRETSVDLSRSFIRTTSRNFIFNFMPDFIKNSRASYLFPYLKVPLGDVFDRVDIGNNIIHMYSTKQKGEVIGGSKHKKRIDHLDKAFDISTLYIKYNVDRWLLVGYLSMAIVSILIFLGTCTILEKNSFNLLEILRQENWNSAAVIGLTGLIALLFTFLDIRHKSTVILDIITPFRVVSLLALFATILMMALSLDVNNSNEILMYINSAVTSFNKPTT